MRLLRRQRLSYGNDQSIVLFENRLHLFSSRKFTTPHWSLFSISRNDVFLDMPYDDWFKLLKLRNLEVTTISVIITWYERYKGTAFPADSTLGEKELGHPSDGAQQLGVGQKNMLQSFTFYNMVVMLHTVLNKEFGTSTQVHSMVNVELNLQQFGNKFYLD